MTEIAGFVLGAVRIAGVIGVFKDTVEVFNLIAESRHLGRDYEILKTKLDIEKTLLLMWASRVRLLSPDYDRRLDDPDVRKLVVRMLECIASLFANVPDIIARYGLDNSNGPGNCQEDSVLVLRTPRISECRWQGFLAEYTTLRSSKEGKTLPAPFFKRARWIIRDKSKFETLISEVAHFTAKINEVMPVSREDSSMRILADADVNSIHGIQKLQILKEASVGSSSVITASVQHAIRETCKDHILNKLWFRRIDDRRESIQEAHSKTFQWALSPATSEVVWDDLSEWLRSGSGIYWISGKAGSGKSTLMKSIFMDKRLGSLSSQWAAGKPYTLCNYFFTNLGTTEQKTQEGLSRTLLYQVLSANRDLIPQTLPYMWKEIHDQKQDVNEDDINLPTITETKQAFDVIARSCDRVCHFCFLIDGLDEFDGNYQDGIDFLKRITSNKNIKVVTSSRPIPSCVAAFTSSPKLQLQDLTRTDITTYVYDTLGSHEYMKILIQQDANGPHRLMQDVCAKSSGHNTCRSLMRGFSDYDSISELHRRVDELPPELEDMFKYMLANINEGHRIEGSKILRACYEKQATPWDTLPLFTFGLAMIFEYPSGVFYKQIFGIRNSMDWRKFLCKSFQGRLRSRCGGLLETTCKASNTLRLCLCHSATGEHCQLIDSEVSFMHRTVFEFLNHESTWDLECLQMPHDTYNAATAMALYIFHLLLDLNLTTPARIGLPFSLALGLRWAVAADESSHIHSKQFFDCLNSFMRHLESTSDTHLSEFRSGFYTDPDLFPLLLAIEAGAVNYVQNDPQFQPISPYDRLDRFLCKYHSVLYHAVDRPMMFRLCDGNILPFTSSPSRTMAKALLDNGFNPNIHIRQPALQTTWIVWLQKLSNKSLPETQSSTLYHLHITEDFLQAGADPHARFLFKNAIPNS